MPLPVVAVSVSTLDDGAESEHRLEEHGDRLVDDLTATQSELFCQPQIRAASIIGNGCFEPHETFAPQR